MLALALVMIAPTTAGAAQDVEDGNESPLVVPASQVTTDIDPARAYNQPQLLVHPDDPMMLAIVGANYNAGRCGAWVSLDGGRTWRKGEGVAKPQEYETCVRSDFGPYLGGALSADGTIFLASAADDLGGQQDVNNLYLSRSTDLGDTWETTVVHEGGSSVEFTEVDGDTKVGGEHFSLVRMGIDHSDPRYVYVGARLGHADRAAPYGLFGDVAIRSVIAASDDGGRTFGELVDITSNVPRNEIAGSYVPSITVGSDGTVYAFHRERTPPDSDAEPFEVGDPPGSPGAGGRLLFSTSVDHGKTWETKSIDDSAVECAGSCQSNPEGVFDPETGNLYVVFGQRETADEEQNILLMRSTDGGETWSDHIRVNHHSADRDHTLPGISVAPGGRVDVAWHDYRNDLLHQPAASRDDREYWDIYASFSTDGGLTWAEDFRVSDRSMRRSEGYTFNSNYGLGGPAGVASTDDVAHFAWADSRRGTSELPVEDYYFTSAFLDGNALDGTAEGGSSDAVKIALGAILTLVLVGLILLGTLLFQKRRSNADSP